MCIMKSEIIIMQWWVWSLHAMSIFVKVCKTFYKYILIFVYTPIFFCQIIEIPPGGELLNFTKSFDFLPGLAFEGFPNRDSTVYQTLYGIENAKTFIRGTLRYYPYLFYVY